MTILQHELSYTLMYTKYNIHLRETP